MGYTLFHSTSVRCLVFVAAFFLLNDGVYGQAARRTPRSDADPIHVYPNPSAGKFTIVVRDQSYQFDINIYNLMGEMVYHWESADQAAATIEVDMTRRPDGVYFVELDTEKANVLKRIVLERQQ